MSLKPFIDLRGNSSLGQRLFVTYLPVHHRRPLPRRQRYTLRLGASWQANARNSDHV